MISSPALSTSERDCFDMPISGADAPMAAAYNDYVFQFLGYGSELRQMFVAADETPGCALAQAHAATLHLAFEGAEGWAAAEPYLERMRTARTKGPITEREALYCDTVEAWYRRDFHTALTTLDTLTVRWPADLCAIKWGQYHAFNLGDQAALLRFGQRATIAHENTPYAHGLIAFALEQNHQLGAAEEEGKRAVEIALDDAWAHHAVAHVLETRGQVNEGIRWMEHCAHTWDKKGVFIRDHNWWHAALFHLANDDPARVLKIYDERLWGVWPEFPQEQIGAISMLWRLELLGVDVGERWQPIVDQVRIRTNEHILPFHDLHYICALAHSGESSECDMFLSGMAIYADQLSGNARASWNNVAIPVAKGMIAFKDQDYPKALESLREVLPSLHQIGGSHAQRQLFLDTYAYAEQKLHTKKSALSN